jgi:hypothetical protein
MQYNADSRAYPTDSAVGKRQPTRRDLGRSAFTLLRSADLLVGVVPGTDLTKASFKSCVRWSLRQPGLAHALRHVLGILRIPVEEFHGRNVEVRLQP